MEVPASPAASPEAPTPAPASAPPPAVASPPAKPFDALVTRLTRDLAVDGDVEGWSTQAWAAYRSKNYVEARRWFARLAQHETAAWKHPHNLACASARAGEIDDARVALEESLRRGGAAARSKAEREADFEVLRGEPWFAVLLDPTSLAARFAELRFKPLVPSEQAAASAGIVVPSPFPLGVTAIDASFEPYRDLLRATRAVSGGRRTAYGRRKLRRDVSNALLPNWTKRGGRRDLSDPVWWQPVQGHRYLVVPFSLKGYDAQFGEPVDIEGYALYAVVDDGLVFVHGYEVDPRSFGCGEDVEFGASFFDRDARAIYEVQGCSVLGRPEMVHGCVVELDEGALRRGCTGTMNLAISIGPE